MKIIGNKSEGNVKFGLFDLNRHFTTAQISHDLI